MVGRSDPEGWAAATGSPGLDVGPPRTCRHQAVVLAFKFEFRSRTDAHDNASPSHSGPFKSRVKWLLDFAFVMDGGDVELEAIPLSLIADIAAQYPGLKALNLSGNSEPHHIISHHAPRLQ